MRQTQKLKDIHAEMMAGLDAAYSAQWLERKQSLEDRRFYSIPGAMWEGDLGAQFENKPKMEVNKIMLAVIRIFNEYRNNRITVDFVAKDGSDKPQLAEACDALYRATEQESVADEAYDNAFDEAVGGGMGAFRLIAEYEDEEDEDNESQRICIKPIFDADSVVYFDVDSKRQDKSDAKAAWLLTSMSEDAYKEAYGKDINDIGKRVTRGVNQFDWFVPNQPFVAEYYVKEDERRTLHTFENPMTSEEKRLVVAADKDDEDDVSDYETGETRADLEATGWKFLKSRTINRPRVHKYICDGSEVLEDCGLIAGKHIPIVPVYGKRWFVDGIERFMGHVRLAKDAQRLKNMQLSKLAEISALSAVEKPIVFPEQVSGLEAYWKDDNLNNYPFLPINPIRDDAGNIVLGGPISYTKPPTLPPAMAALLQITEQDIADILGNQQNGEKLDSNISGKAVEMVQTRLDMQAFIYMSNMSKAIKRSGEIWLSMAKDLYIEKGRKLKGMTKQGDTTSLELMRPVMKNGAAIVENDLSSVNLDVSVDVGPSSESKRSATVRTLTNIAMMTEDPETKKILLGTAMLNVEGEGLTELNEFYRRQMLKMGVVQPTEEEKAEMAEEQKNTPPDPNAEFLKASAAELMSKAKKADSDVVLNMAKSAKTEAEAMEVLAGLDAADQQAAQQSMQQMQPQQMAPVSPNGQ